MGSPSTRYMGTMLVLGVPCGKLQDGVKAEVRTWAEDPRAAVLTVHATAVLKRWDEHELTEDVEYRDLMLRRAGRLEAEAKEIREEWGWS
jgi:hypothetical protein